MTLLEMIDANVDENFIAQYIEHAPLHEIEDCLHAIDMRELDANTTGEFYKWQDWGDFIRGEAGIPYPDRPDPEAEAERRYFDMHDPAYVNDLRTPFEDTLEYDSMMSGDYDDYEEW